MVLSQVGKWAGSLGPFRRLLRKTIISITKDIEQDKQNLPLQIRDMRDFPRIVHIMPAFQRLYLRFWTGPLTFPVLGKCYSQSRQISCQKGGGEV